MFEANQDGGMTPRIPKIFVTGFIVLLVIFISGGKMFYNVDPGEKAILFKRFSGGLDKEKVYDQGFHVVAPWNKFYIYNVKIQEDYEEMEVLSKNGLSIKLDLSFRYNPVMADIGHLHDLVGKDYLYEIVAGIIGSKVVRYDIFGEGVYIAKKMEQNGIAGKICISEETK